MRVLRSGKALPIGLALTSVALALVQRPGWASSDTKIDLHVDPVGFLGELTSAWTPTGTLGHVWGAQYAGYLFPMGPFFALGRLLGLPPWVVERLWLGTLLALAAWGTVRLLDALLDERRGVAHLVAGALVVLNPFVVTATTWRSVFLLGYVALPWLLLAVHRGVRDPRGWWWPAAFALLVTATGGGVNAAITAFALVGPALLLVYEPLTGAVRWADIRGFALRAVPLTLVASAWWLAPIAVQLSSGVDFQQFTEGTGTIWRTTSVTESLRLMGYWVSYAGVGLGKDLEPYLSDSVLLLHSPPVVAASLVVPGLALAGFAWTRRWRYGPYFLALAIVAVLLMFAGFPPAAPLRRLLTEVHDKVEASQFLRTTYKAAPLLAIAVACLAGVAAREAVRRMPRRLLPAAAVVGLALALLQAWPLARGDAVEDAFLWKRIPAAWNELADDLDRELPPGTRALVLPGQLYGYYRWGGTDDPLLPALAERPVAGRFLVPFADFRATDLLWSTDALVQDQRVQPGQLQALMRLLGVGAVVSGTDDDRARSGTLPVADAAHELRLAGLDRPDEAYGPRRRFAAPGYTLGRTELLPDLRRYDLHGPGMVRTLSAGPATLVDGSADALAGLAALGDLPEGTPLMYAADTSRAELRRAGRSGASFVVSDSNRRRVFSSSRIRANEGWTLGAHDPLPADAAVLNPFPGLGTDGQTVAELDGARYVRAPFSPTVLQFPERRPYAAFDGSERTVWLADGHLAPEDHWIELGFEQPRDVDYLDLLPYGDSLGRIEEVDVNGKRFRVRRRWNRLAVGLRRADRLRVSVTKSRRPEKEDAAPGGFAEIRVPGPRVREWLRPPRLVDESLRGTDLRRSALTYLFERTTGPDPYRPSKLIGELQDQLVRDARDGEDQLARVVEVPAARSFEAEALLSLDPSTPDYLIDRLAGYRGGGRFSSSSRFEGTPRSRASGAFDGDPRRGWVGIWMPRRPAWIGWRTSKPLALGRLRIRRDPRALRVPTRVRLRWPGGATRSLPVGPHGWVSLGRRVRGRSFRLEVLAARFPEGTPASVRARRAVAIAELELPGLSAASIPREGSLAADCGAAEIEAGGRRLALRASGRVAELDAGRPLRARSCGQLPLGPGRVRLHSRSPVFRVDLLRLHSAAPAGLPAPTGGGVVLDPGDDGRGRRDGVRVSVGGPSWLVLGESYDRGWRARCSGRDLGPARPVQGYANGWRVDSWCREASFSFAPNGPARWALVLSAIACLILATVLVLRRRPREAAPPPELRADDPIRPWPLRRALAIGAVAGLVLGFVFALRAGVVLGPLVALVLWRGVGARELSLAAGALLAVLVPAVYLLFPPRDLGGYNSNYAVELLGAHWIGVGALVLTGLALWRSLAAAVPIGGRVMLAREWRPRRSPSSSRPSTRSGGSRTSSR